MDELEAAIAIAERLRASLEAEIERSRAQRLLIRSLDSDALFESARRRELFNHRVAALDGELRAAVAAAALRLGLAGSSLSALRLAAPAAGRRLAARFAELRSLLQALREIDQLNSALTLRALRWVRGCITALAPGSAGYDRRGSQAALGRLSTAVRVA